MTINVSPHRWQWFSRVAASKTSNETTPERWQ
jgi:hypothetical protein